MREIREILKDLGAEILSMKEAGVDVDIVKMEIHSRQMR